jgi:hypothetical protein
VILIGLGFVRFVLTRVLVLAVPIIPVSTGIPVVAVAAICLLVVA